MVKSGINLTQPILNMPISFNHYIIRIGVQIVHFVINEYL